MTAEAQPAPPEPAPAQPSTQSLAKRLLKAAIVFVVVLEAADEVRAFWRRMSRRANWWMSGVEQHERRRLHIEELAFLIRRMNPR